MQSLLEAVAIEKGIVPLVEVKNYAAGYLGTDSGKMDESAVDEKADLFEILKRLSVQNKEVCEILAGRKDQA